MSETQKINKSYKLWAPITKSAGGRVEVILSDDSIDLDGEIVGKNFLQKAVDEELINGLMDHENKALNVVCEWVNKRLVNKNGHNALIAEPKWFLSNPNAQVLKSMIENDGARMGVSITAIPTDHENVKVGDKMVKTWTDGKIVSADFVGIPANLHARALAIAKMFTTSEDDSMNEEEVNKAISEKVEELQKSLDQSEKLAMLEKEVSELKATIEKMSEEPEPAPAEPEPEKVEEEAAPAEEESEEPSLAEEREKSLKGLSLPEANTGAEPKSDEDVGVGNFVKALNNRG